MTTPEPDPAAAGDGPPTGGRRVRLVLLLGLLTAFGSATTPGTTLAAGGR
jgi:hypothetical protein